MSDIADGLQTFAIVRSYIALFILILLLISVVIIYINILNSQYTKASDGEIIYGEKIGNNYISCNINNPNCNYYAEYTGPNNIKYTEIITKQENNEPIGETSLYYSYINPTSYSISSINPTNILCVSIIILLICGLGLYINIYLESKYKGYGATIGALGIINSIRLFRGL
jgi:hypothetical protein